VDHHNHTAKETDTVAEDRIALLELVEEYADADLFRELGQYALQRLMEMEAEQIVGAGHHELSEERTTHRNGYRDRRLETRMGTMNLKIPKLRSGTYFPSFLEPRKMSEQALVAVVQEAYVKGDDLVQALGMSGISKSQVSQLCSELDGRVQSFLKRELTGHWPYVWLDATYLKSRENGHVVTRALVVAVGATRRAAERFWDSPGAGGDRGVLDRDPARPRDSRAHRRAPGNL
jgi:transposase-like protein